MIAAESEEKKTTLKDKVLERLHDPFQLRLCLTACVIAIGYFAIYSPLDGRIAEANAELEKETRLAELARNVEGLRVQFAAMDKRLPKQTDTNEWVQYVLEGVRKLPLRLVEMTSETPRNLGPYKAVYLRMDLEGTFPEMDRLLRWIEGNERLFRLDAVQIAPSRSNKNVLVLQVTLLGVMG
jgi:Tfp pilus assembly protein PilO